MLLIFMIAVFMTLVILYLKKSSEVDESIIYRKEYRERPFAIERRWRIKNPRGRKKWTNWGHVSHHKTPKSRDKDAMEIKKKCKDDCQIRYVNYIQLPSQFPNTRFR